MTRGTTGGSGLGRRAALGLTLAAPVIARAQGTAPDGPIRLIVPYPPGGPADLFARLIARPMSERLGQPVVADNRTGASGILGLEAMARARPDGQTLCLTSIGALVLQPYTVARLPYDVGRDVLGVANAVGVQQVLAVGRKLPVSSVAELVDHAKRNPGKVSFGSAGVGGLTHLAGELFGLRAGIDITHVPYRGAAPAVNDLVAGQLDMVTLDLPGVLPTVGQNGVRALAVLTRERSVALPDVPTIVEAGLPGAVNENSYPLLAPAGTPPDRVERIRTALNAALAEESVRKTLLEQGAVPLGGSGEALAEIVRRESAKWAEVVRTLGRERFE
ncbi:Bug family tripartite tricarboxylate transporter substrate binding protein [Muricoccus radiodurans]|uniref:Bug family tripartite tricarboxylate transporter substrate binding protein n=1 Tax=Muricoccus radiodurans TaxID=2231721 RepID=UPI003CF49799